MALACLKVQILGETKSNFIFLLMLVLDRNGKVKGNPWAAKTLIQWALSGNNDNFRFGY